MVVADVEASATVSVIHERTCRAAPGRPACTCERENESRVRLRACTLRRGRGALFAHWHCRLRTVGPSFRPRLSSLCTLDKRPRRPRCFACSSRLSFPTRRRRYGYEHGYERTAYDRPQNDCLRTYYLLRSLPYRVACQSVSVNKFISIIKNRTRRARDNESASLRCRGASPSRPL
jgi:hypothetical protein